MKIKKLFNFLFECEYKVLLTLFLLFCIGIVYGCFSSAVTYSVSGRVDAISVHDFTALDNLFSLLIKNLLILFFIFISGFSALGIPFICFIVIYYGVTCGTFFMFFLYSNSLKGVLVAVICYYVYYLINFITCACVSFSSIRLSLVLFNVFRTDNHHVDPRIYCYPHIIKLFCYVAVVVLSSGYYMFITNKIINLLL